MAIGNQYQRFMPGMINSSGPTIPILSNPQAHYANPNGGFTSNSSGPGNDAGGTNPFSNIQNSIVQSGLKQGIKEGASQLMPESWKAAFNNNITYPLQDAMQPSIDSAKQAFGNFTEPFKNSWGNLTGSNTTAVDGAPNILNGSSQVSLPQTVQMAELPAPAGVATAPEQFGPLASEGPGAFTGSTGSAFAPESGSMSGLFGSSVPDVSTLGMGGTDAIGAGWGAGEGTMAGVEGATAGAEAGATAAGTVEGASLAAAPEMGPMAWIPLAIAAAAAADNATGGHIIAAPMETLQNPTGFFTDPEWWGNISGYNSLFGDGGLFG